MNSTHLNVILQKVLYLINEVIKNKLGHIGFTHKAPLMYMVFVSLTFENFDFTSGKIHIHPA